MLKGSLADFYEFATSPFKNLSVLKTRGQKLNLTFNIRIQTLSNPEGVATRPYGVYF